MTSRALGVLQFSIGVGERWSAAREAYLVLEGVLVLRNCESRLHNAVCEKEYSQR